MEAANEGMPTRGPARGLELGAYLALAMACVGPALRDPRLVVGDSIDLPGTLWFYAWIRDSLATGSSPGTTPLFFHPYGKDIFAHTGGNFLDAVLSLPFQTVFGFPRYEAFFVAFLLLCNALAFRPLARRVVDGRAEGSWIRRALLGPRLSWPAFLGVLLWVSCPYVLFELNGGRLTQALLCFLPLSVDAFLELEDTDRPWRPALRSGLLLSLQAWSYWFMGYFGALLLAWIALGTAFRLRGDRRTLGRYALACLVAALTSILLVLPALLPMLSRIGEGLVPGLEASGPSSAASTAGSPVGWWLMETRGAPMLAHASWIALALLGLIFGRERARWLGGAVLALVLAVGPTLALADGRLISWMPYTYLAGIVPFLGRLWFPYRLVVVAFLCLSLAAPLALARLISWLPPRHPAARRGLLGGALPAGLALGIVAWHLVEQHVWGEFPLVTRRVEPSALYAWIGALAREEGGVQALIELPIGVTQSPVLDQIDHGRPLFGGIGETAPPLWPEGHRARMETPWPRFLREVTRNPVGLGVPESPDSLDALIRQGFRWVVLDRATVEEEAALRDARPSSSEIALQSARTLRRALGAPVAVDGPRMAWDLEGRAVPPAALKPTDRAFEKPTWTTAPLPAHERVLRSKGRMALGSAPR